MTEMIYEYDGSFDGLLCCIFDSYAYREIPTAICREEDAVPTLYATRRVGTVGAHADRVLRKVRQYSPDAADLLWRGYLTCLPDKELHLYRLVVKLLKDGPAFLRRFSDPVLYPIANAVRHLNSEAHLLKGFVRFSDLGGVLAGEIAPKNRVLPLLRGHFCARYQGERFFIYDRTHREALFYAAGQAVIRPLVDFQLAPPDGTEAHYRLLWRRFYDTVAIRERENPRCRRTNMPMRYWGAMTEFQEDEVLTAPRSPAAGPAPDAPAGISAPGTRR